MLKVALSVPLITAPPSPPVSDRSTLSRIPRNGACDDRRTQAQDRALSGFRWWLGIGQFGQGDPAAREGADSLDRAGAVAAEQAPRFYLRVVCMAPAREAGQIRVLRERREGQCVGADELAHHAGIFRA